MTSACARPGQCTRPQVHAGSFVQAAAQRCVGHRRMGVERRCQRVVLALHRRLRDAHERVRWHPDLHAVATRVGPRLPPAVSCCSVHLSRLRKVPCWLVLNVCSHSSSCRPGPGAPCLTGRSRCINPASSFSCLLTTKHGLPVGAIRCSTGESIRSAWLQGKRRTAQAWGFPR